MSLRVWLPLNGDLHNQGCSNASVTNTSATTNTTGKIGSCYSFGTSKSYLKFDNMNFIHNFTECSVSLWLKILSWNTSYATYFQFGLGSTPWAHYIFGLLRNGTASTLCFTISDGSSATNANCLTPTLDLNTWYHLTFTYSDGHCKIYVNGIETKDYNTTIVPNFAGINTGTIGACNNGSNYQTNCLMNDVRIYDHCLSAAEVKEIAQGLILHYKLDGGVTTAKNLIKNGYGELGTTNWNSSTNFSLEVPPDHPEIKKSIYSNITTEYIPIESTHSYKLEVYLKNSATSGNTYPSLYPYDIDKNFIYVYNCPEGFNLSTMTFLTQELKSGDTKIYVDDLSKWNANSGTYYNYAAIFNYNDSTGYVYPNGTYTRNTPAFGSGTTAKTNLDKTNNIITLNSTYSGPTKPVGTAICAATDGATYYYPFGGLAKSSLNDWTYKTTTIIPNNIARLKYAKYIRYSTFDGTLHAGIKLIDLADDIDSTIISDSSGYGHNGEIINTLNIFSNTPKYEASTYFSNSAYIKTLNFNFPSNIWTVSCWYYRDTNPSTYEAIFCLSKGNGVDANKKIAAIPNSGRIWFKGESGSLSISKLNISAWTMLTMTCNGTTVKIYENSSLLGSFSAGNQMTECTDLIIGARANSTNATSIAVPYTGSISDFRIYCTPLLDTDIKQLYNVSMKIDNKQQIHTFELYNKSTNLLRSELIIPAAKAGYTSGIGEITMHNNVYAYNITPAPFYKNISSSESGILKGQFAANTSYILDMWIDVDSVIYNGNNVAGGLTVRYTDGTSNTKFVLTGGNKGYQHRILITPNNKTIDRLDIYYYTSTDVFYRADSYIGIYTTEKIKKTGILDTGNLSEIDNITQFVKGGHIHTKQIIER